MAFRSRFLWMFLGLMAPLQAQDDLSAKIQLLADAYPEILVMGVLYNQNQQLNIPVPAHVGSIRLIAVPVADLSEISGAVKDVLLEEYTIQALFLLDDEGRLVTSKKSIKYLSRLGIRHNFRLISNTPQVNSAIAVRVINHNGGIKLVGGGQGP